MGTHGNDPHLSENLLRWDSGACFRTVSRILAVSRVASANPTDGGNGGGGALGDRLAM
jgi:hypothetical protein